MALVIDGALMGFLGIGVVMVVTIVSVPFWSPENASAGLSGGSAQALDGVLPAWLTWVMLGAVGLLAVGLSGAMSRSGHRVSQGFRFCELELVVESGAGRPTVGLPSEGERPEMEPARWRVASRWLTPLGLFALASVLVGGLGAAAVALAAWAPALLNGRRSLYDYLAGVVVVDGARAARQRMERKGQKGT